MLFLRCLWRWWRWAGNICPIKETDSERGGEGPLAVAVIDHSKRYYLNKGKWRSKSLIILEITHSYWDSKWFVVGFVRRPAFIHLLIYWRLQKANGFNNDKARLESWIGWGHFCTCALLFNILSRPTSQLCPAHTMAPAPVELSMYRSYFDILYIAKLKMV